MPKCSKFQVLFLNQQRQNDSPKNWWLVRGIILKFVPFCEGRIPRLFGRVPKRSIACGAQSPVTVHDDFFRFIATYFMGVIMYCPTLAEFRSKYQSPFLFKGWVWDLMHCCFCWLGINPKNCQISQVASQWMDSIVKCNHGILKFGVDHQMGVTAKMHHPRWD